MNKVDQNLVVKRNVLIMGLILDPQLLTDHRFGDVDSETPNIHSRDIACSVRPLTEGIMQKIFKEICTSSVSQGTC